MLKRIEILGVPVSIVNMHSAVEEIAAWIPASESRYVCATDVHSVMQAQRNPRHMGALCEADMVIPDGTPIVWISHARGEASMQRVCGPDIMPSICERAAREGWRQYFYGGAEGVAEAVAEQFAQRFPGMIVAGTRSPPYHELSDMERDAEIAQINAARPDILWVALGCPKQEIWMRDNVRQLHGTVAIGVGAAFDFHSGRIARAPLWMRSSGLEWLHRLTSEPGRLWRRYIVMAPQFVVQTAVETWRIRQLERKTAVR